MKRKTRPPGIYLDSCALNRPFDDQTVARNRVEAQAVVVLLEAVAAGRVNLISSQVLDYENARNPFPNRREEVAAILATARMAVGIDARLAARARAIEAQGISGLDALHIAAAERAGARWFVTCDDGIIRLARSGRLSIRVEAVSPRDLLDEREFVDG
jgi:hypothetical protein